MFTHVYWCLPMFTDVYRYLSLFTHVYWCLQIFTLVYPRLLMFTLVYCLVYWCLPLFTDVYPCLLDLPHMYLFKPMFTLVYLCFLFYLIFTKVSFYLPCAHVYLILPYVCLCFLIVCPSLSALFYISMLQCETQLFTCIACLMFVSVIMFTLGKYWHFLHQDIWLKYQQHIRCTIYGVGIYFLRTDGDFLWISWYRIEGDLL